MKIVITVIFLFAGIAIRAQDLEKSDLKSDLLKLKEAIQEYNPALDAYNPDFDQKADSLIASVKRDSVPMIQAFKKISQLCALSNEGHFSLGNWTDTVHSGFMQNRFAYLPISVSILEDKIYIWSDFSDEQELKRGDQILSINGLKAPEILAELYTVTPSDGDILTYPRKTIELGFSWMYYLYVSQVDQHEIVVKGQGGVSNTTFIRALNRDKLMDNYGKYYPKDESAEEGSFYQLKFENETAILTLPSFDYRKVEKYDVKAKKLYKEIFTDLQAGEVENLVIDLRGNTGGRNEFAYEMVPFIQKSNDEFLKKSISWAGKEKTYKFPKPSNLVFKGAVYVLVDGRTYSAGSSLARYLNEYADARIIGEETGTRYEGFAAGSKQFVKLANSKIEIGIPRYHFYFPKSEIQQTTNRGLIPDFPVVYSIDALNSQRDVHLEILQTLIR
jgi:hypothetical protein